MAEILILRKAEQGPSHNKLGSYTNMRHTVKLATNNGQFSSTSLSQLLWLINSIASKSSHAGKIIQCILYSHRKNDFIAIIGRVFEIFVLEVSVIIKKASLRLASLWYFDFQVVVIFKIYS